MAIDLNQIRAAKAEVEKEQPVLLVNDKEYKLPIRLTVSTIDLLDQLGGKNDFEVIKQLLTILVGKKEAPKLMEELSVDECYVIFGGLLDEYGLTAGNSTASARSSTNGGQKRRRPSRSTTASTSPEPATETKQSASVGSGS